MKFSDAMRCDVQWKCVWSMHTIVRRFTFSEMMKMKNMPQSCYRSFYSEKSHCMALDGISFILPRFFLQIFRCFVTFQSVMSYYFFVPLVCYSHMLWQQYHATTVLKNLIVFCMPWDTVDSVHSTHLIDCHAGSHYLWVYVKMTVQSTFHFASNELVSGKRQKNVLLWKSKTKILPICIWLCVYDAFRNNAIDSTIGTTDQHTQCKNTKIWPDRLCATCETVSTKCSVLRK